jgi:hypothetical protein
MLQVVHHDSYWTTPLAGSMNERVAGGVTSGFGPRGMMPGSRKEVTTNQKMADAKHAQQV